MSVFGGDSWGREAEYRKRRVDDVVLESLNASSFKKLASGKYACLVCSHSPILDTPLLLSMHCNGSRHLAAESRMRETEHLRQDEINKRLALVDSSVGSTNTVASGKKAKLACKPLIEQTKKATYEIFHDKAQKLVFLDQHLDVKSCEGHVMNVAANFSEKSSCSAVEASEISFMQQQLDFRERQERELKFIEAGWKRDCHGKWYRDENVEFDSDEEDPNVCLD